MISRVCPACSLGGAPTNLRSPEQLFTGGLPAPPSEFPREETGCSEQPRAGFSKREKPRNARREKRWIVVGKEIAV